jgi:hypothetical protein
MEMKVFCLSSYLEPAIMNYSIFKAADTKEVSTNITLFSQGSSQLHGSAAK